MRQSTAKGYITFLSCLSEGKVNNGTRVNEPATFLAMRYTMTNSGRAAAATIAVQQHAEQQQRQQQHSIRI